VKRSNPRRRPVCLCLPALHAMPAHAGQAWHAGEWQRSNLRLINIGVYNYVDVYQFA